MCWDDDIFASIHRWVFGLIGHKRDPSKWKWPEPPPPNTYTRTSYCPRNWTLSINCISLAVSHQALHFVMVFSLHPHLTDWTLRLILHTEDQEEPKAKVAKLSEEAFKPRKRSSTATFRCTRVSPQNSPNSRRTACCAAVLLTELGICGKVISLSILWLKLRAFWHPARKKKMQKIKTERSIAILWEFGKKKNLWHSGWFDDMWHVKGHFNLEVTTIFPCPELLRKFGRKLHFRDQKRKPMNCFCYSHSWPSWNQKKSIQYHLLHCVISFFVQKSHVSSPSFCRGLLSWFCLALLICVLRIVSFCIQMTQTQLPLIVKALVFSSQLSFERGSKLFQSNSSSYIPQRTFFLTQKVSFWIWCQRMSSLCWHW